MPNRKEQLENGEVYHITLRRVGDKLLFEDIDDYYRGIFSIYEFNNSNFVEIRKRREERKRWKQQISGNPIAAGIAAEIVMGKAKQQISVEPDKRDKLVDILCFCLMPNHIHLLVIQLKDGGISKFMQKFGGGFASYFREKHQISKRGHFFNGAFNAVHIKNDEQLQTVFAYIHTNPIALIEPGWKERGIKNPQKTIEFLENYKWSSYQDYLGKKNFPSVTEREFMLEVMSGEKGCKDSVDSWVEYKNEISKFIALGLEID